MTAPSPSLPEPITSPVVVQAPVLAVTDIDRSCRIAVLFLFTAAVFWLGVGALFGWLAAIKAHAPGFLAAPACLTYGRVRPAAASALVYGFVLQSGLGVALWMFCRLGRNLLRGGRMLAGAAVFWNVGLLVGIGLILAGGNTGYEWLEMPGAASPVLFLGYVLLGGWALVTLHAREERPFYVSQWFLLAAILWFPWVYSTAQLLLIFFPVRGVMQAVIAGWYVENLFELCLAPFGLAVIFYFIPKLLGRPLHSRGLALFGFWLLVFFGGWGGLRPSEPVPNWITGVSAVARVFILLPVITFAMSWWRTLLADREKARSDVLLRFMIVAAVSYVIAAVLDTLGAHPLVARVTAFTLYDHGIAQLKLHGFLSMALAGAIYYITPRLVRADWPAPRWIGLHFWCATIGMALLSVALIVGGLVEGGAINNPQTDFTRIVRTTVPFLGTSTLGMTLLLVAYVLLLAQLGRLLTVYCPCAAIWEWLRPSRPATAVPRRAAR